MNDPDFDRRYAAALSELEAAGISRSRSEPPYVRIMRGLGVKVRPVHYQGAWAIFVAHGVTFGIFWGCLRYLIQWRAQGTPLPVGLATATLAGVLFGAAMALLNAHQRKKKNLTLWKNL